MPSLNFSHSCFSCWTSTSLCRKWLDERCRQVVDFKRSVCKEGETFVIINQKGVDPLSLDIFAKEGILCMRRAKRRNMEVSFFITLLRAHTRIRARAYTRTINTRILHFYLAPLAQRRG